MGGAVVPALFKAMALSPPGRGRGESNRWSPSDSKPKETKQADILTTSQMVGFIVAFMSMVIACAMMVYYEVWEGEGEGKGPPRRRPHPFAPAQSFSPPDLA